MRAGVAVVVASLVAVGTATAREAPFRDPYWDLECVAESFVERARAGGDAQLLAARVDGDVALEVVVLEDEAERDPAAWLTELRARWREEGRGAGAAAEPDASGTLLFTEPGLGAAPRRHAYTVRPRGVHGFVVHAVGVPGDDVRLRAALASVRVGSSRRASLRGAALARDQGVDPADLHLAAHAIAAYLGAQPPRPRIAAQIAEATVFASASAPLPADELWSIAHGIGLAALASRDCPRALEWLARARRLAEGAAGRDEALPLTLYNTACAHAVGGDADRAFSVLDELVAAGGWAPHAAWAQEDPDFASLRDDPRWKRLPAPQRK